MGSLMGGWDSPVQPSKHGTYERNNSLTKEEIDAYWKSKKKAEDEENNKNYRYEDEEGTKGPYRRRSNSLPISGTDKDTAGEEGQTSWEELSDSKAKGWWRRSNWAFLNEPPVFEGTTRGYSSQFNVASFQNDKDSTAFSP